MLITQVTTIGFHPVKECDEILNFEAANDMNDWHKSESTVMTTYTRTQWWTVDKKERT